MACKGIFVKEHDKCGLDRFSLLIRVGFFLFDAGSSGVEFFIGPLLPLLPGDSGWSSVARLLVPETSVPVIGRVGGRRSQDPGGCGARSRCSIVIRFVFPLWLVRASCS